VVIEPLSPRVLYSADPLGFGGHSSLPEELADNNEFAAAIPFTDDKNSAFVKTHVVFVDSAISNHAEVIHSLTTAIDDGNQLILYTLEATDSVDTISEKLQTHSNLAAVHFIAHGSNASIELGASTLNNQSIQNYHHDLMSWGEALTDDGDILFYGCNVAETAAGEQLLTEIARATQADVAASTDLTGHHSKGGDWTLEFSTGVTDENEGMFATELAQWDSLLQNQTMFVTNNLDKVNGNVSSAADLIATPGPDGISLREAILAANANYDHDTIQLGTDTYITKSVLHINSLVTLKGNGPDATFITGDGSDRIFRIEGTNVDIEALEIHNGNTPGGSETAGGRHRQFIEYHFQQQLCKGRRSGLRERHVKPFRFTFGKQYSECARGWYQSTWPTQLL